MKQSSKNLADQLFPIINPEEETSVVDIPPEKRRLHTETYDFSISTIKDYLDNKTFFIPKFQRGYVWTRAQASRLIESLIIQCPIPVIYLNQEQDETLAVIDGNQRLNSIKLFLDDQFELQGLTAYPELEGNTYSNLDPRIRRHILNRTLRCITILKETHPQIKIDVFERLNTGAVQLNAQEVRHGIYHGPLMELIDELSQEKIWKNISSIKNDQRMKGGELILRYFSLLHDQGNYKKPLKKFLNEFCDNNKKISDSQKLEWKRQFISAIELVDTLFGELAFKTLNRDLRPAVRNINAALFDAVMIGITRSGVTREQVNQIKKDHFLQEFQILTNEARFKETIESGTSATTAVNYRINAVQEFMQRSLI